MYDTANSILSRAPYVSRMIGRPGTHGLYFLQCGNLTLPSCVCPHCYSKIREKTDELKSMLGGDFKVRTIQAYFIMENMVQQANDASLSNEG